VLWVDYGTSVALHPVVTSNKKERRVQRLLSPDASDNRITFGCINVPKTFYSKNVQPRFRKKGGVVYIIPDTKPLEDVFPRLRVQPFVDAGLSVDASKQPAVKRGKGSSDGAKPSSRLVDDQRTQSSPISS
jgi:hypothetical protein